MSKKNSARAARARVTLPVRVTPSTNMGMGIVGVRSDLVNVTRHVLVSQLSQSLACWFFRRPLSGQNLGFTATSHDGRAVEDLGIPV